MLVPKQTDWPPFARDRQIRGAIAVEVREYRARNQTEPRESLCVLRIFNPAAIRATKQQRRRCFGIAGRHYPPANEKVDLAVAVNVRGCQRTSGRLLSRQLI